jgi:hypothetical protein
MIILSDFQDSIDMEGFQQSLGDITGHMLFFFVVQLIMEKVL